LVESGAARNDDRRVVCPRDEETERIGLHTEIWDPSQDHRA
jgi:hypothetical protein